MRDAQPIREASICEGRLRYAHFGTALGNASPRAPLAPSRMCRALDALGYGGEPVAVYMQPDFTNLIAELPEGTEPWTSGLWRTRDKCDGVAISPDEPPVLIANGDCCVGVLANDSRAVVMHLGLDCLYRADGSPSVLALAVETLGGPASAMSFFAGGAIGPCCHGYSHHSARERERATKIASQFGARTLSGHVEHGPRRGAYAYDHLAMAIVLADSLGVGDVDADRSCTACAGLADPNAEGYGDFFSHTRDTRGGRERNLVVVGYGVGGDQAFTRDRGRATH